MQPRILVQLLCLTVLASAQEIFLTFSRDQAAENQITMMCEELNMDGSTSLVDNPAFFRDGQFYQLPNPVPNARGIVFTITREEEGSFECGLNRFVDESQRSASIGIIGECSALSWAFAPADVFTTRAHIYTHVFTTHMRVCTCTNTHTEIQHTHIDRGGGSTPPPPLHVSNYFAVDVCCAFVKAHLIRLNLQFMCVISCRAIECCIGSLE